jgi:outer membrane PBP1 activator LpoA protein
MTIFLHRALPLCLLALFFGTFQGCTPRPGISPAQDIPSRQESRTDDESRLAQQLIEQAGMSQGAQRNEYLIEATRQLIADQRFLLAEQTLADIDPTLLNQKQQVSITLLSTEIALNQGRPRDALKLLQIPTILSDAEQIHLLKLRARAFLDAGYAFESSKSRVQLDQLLHDPLEQSRNHQAIWETLSLLPQTSLQQISQAPLNPELLGWVELVKIAKRGQLDWAYLQDGIYQWRQMYPQHPAADIFSRELGKRQIELIEKPQHIAVLLPLSGSYAQLASAIRDGIMSAHYQHPDTQFKPRISFIDTGDNQAAIWSYYQKATELGADFIIGPFLKSAVDTLARSSQMSVPTLTLNYTSQFNNSVNQLFQFGLLPEDEARQSAEMAFRQGHTHAAILTPQGEWGERLRNAFQQRFEELGGKVVSTQSYRADSNDFKRPIQSMLNIDHSYSRYRRIRSISGEKLQFIPYRRQDVDMIFMVATPKDARQLKPQFKFHYAGEIPVYATSHAFSGQVQPQDDRDIDELNFIDMPWILNPPSRFKQSLIKLWPEQQRYTRLFALGVDAYNVIPFIGRLQNRSHERFSGQTGNLYIDPFNRIHRELLWARFENGRPQLIDISNLVPQLDLDEDQPVQSLQ